MANAAACRMSVEILQAPPNNMGLEAVCPACGEKVRMHEIALVKAANVLVGMHEIAVVKAANARDRPETLPIPAQDQRKKTKTLTDREKQKVQTGR